LEPFRDARTKRNFKHGKERNLLADESALADLPESFHPTLRAVRSREGERLVLDENMFIEKMLPAVTQRVLSNEEMANEHELF